jgi:uncharacterized cupredoxin-like copper-binding protein
MPLTTRPSRHANVAFAAVVATFGVTWSACGRASETVAHVELVASESDGDPTSYTFDMPSTAHAGWTEFTLTNADDEEHHAQLLRLNEGVSFEELVDAFARGPAAGFELSTPVGGTSLVAPGNGSQANAIIDLQPGTYAVICLVPGPDGTPHVAHGMARELEVTGSKSNESSPPAADVNVELLDYAFDLRDEIDGESTLDVTNDGTELHELVIAQFSDGASIDDVVAAVHDGTPPPITPVGGLQAIVPGASVRLQLHLPPGRYVAICFVPSSDGTPHLSNGMIKELTIT